MAAGVRRRAGPGGGDYNQNSKEPAKQNPPSAMQPGTQSSGSMPVAWSVSRSGRRSGGGSRRPDSYWVAPFEFRQRYRPLHTGAPPTAAKARTGEFTPLKTFLPERMPLSTFRFAKSPSSLLEMYLCACCIGQAQGRPCDIDSRHILASALSPFLQKAS